MQQTETPIKSTLLWCNKIFCRATKVLCCAGVKLYYNCKTCRCFNQYPYFTLITSAVLQHTTLLSSSILKKHPFYETAARSPKWGIFKPLSVVFITNTTDAIQMLKTLSYTASFYQNSRDLGHLFLLWLYPLSWTYEVVDMVRWHRKLVAVYMYVFIVGSIRIHPVTIRLWTKYVISKIKMLCNLSCLKARFRLLRNTLSTSQQPEPRFKTAKVMWRFYFRNGVSMIRTLNSNEGSEVKYSRLDKN